MKRSGIHLVGRVVLGFLFFETVFAQATAQISGTVRDQSGAVLPGVEITATQNETGISRSTISNQDPRIMQFALKYIF
jgi:carboxypeptidase family protein